MGWDLRGRRVALSLLLIALGLSAAGCGPSAQHYACLDYCERNNDMCMAQATNGPAIQQCSNATTSCVAGCPP